MDGGSFTLKLQTNEFQSVFFKKITRTITHFISRGMKYRNNNIIVTGYARKGISCCKLTETCNAQTLLAGVPTQKLSDLEIYLYTFLLYPFNPRYTSWVKNMRSM